MAKTKKIIIYCNANMLFIVTPGKDEKRLVKMIFNSKPKGYPKNDEIVFIGDRDPADFERVETMIGGGHDVHVELSTITDISSHDLNEIMDC